MGYEINLILVEISPIRYDNYARTIAHVDLCKAGYDTEIMKIHKQTTNEPAMIFGLDGNKQFTKDFYGNKLCCHDPKAVLTALKIDELNHPYRRFKMAIGLLEATIPTYDKALKVVLFGH